MAKEKSSLRKLQTGEDVQPPFPHRDLFNVAFHVQRELLLRADRLEEVFKKMAKWRGKPSHIEPWIGRNSEQVCGRHTACSL